MFKQCTFSSGTVVIWASCMGETLPFGNMMNDETFFFPRTPYRTAEPVLPLSSSNDSQKVSRLAHLAFILPTSEEFEQIA